MNIELKCRFAGFKHGDIVEVGKGEGKISKEEAEMLLGDGFAVEYKAKVIAGDDKLAKEVETLQKEVAAKDVEIATLKQEAEAKDVEIATLKEEVEKLKAAVEKAKTK